MNRRDRRQARRGIPAGAPPEAFRAIAAAYRCPDCDSETSEPYPDPEAGIWRMQVRHDDTCPWYRRYDTGAR